MLNKRYKYFDRSKVNFAINAKFTSQDLKTPSLKEGFLIGIIDRSPNFQKEAWQGEEADGSMPVRLYRATTKRPKFVFKPTVNLLHKNLLNYPSFMEVFFMEFYEQLELPLPFPSTMLDLCISQIYEA